MADIVKRDLDAILPLEKRKLLLSALGRGDAESARDLSDLYDIPEETIVELMNNDEFYIEVCNYTQADLRITHHTLGKKTLKHILEHGEDKDSPGRLKAYDRLTRLVGADTPPTPTDINFFNFGDALPAEKNITPKKTAQAEEPIDVPFKRRLNKNKTAATPIPEEEDVNGNIFEALGQDEEGYDEDGIEELFRNSRENDLTN